MIDPGTVIELVKTGTGTLSQYIISDPVTVIANFCTLTGFSLRNVKGLFGFKKLGENLKEKFPNGLETEEQETILSDCFMELEDYIKNSSNLDDKVFEKIGELLIHGLENKDLLTREYIRILKQLTWIDLQIFLKLSQTSYKIKEKSNISLKIEVLAAFAIEDIKEKFDYPEELIEEKIKKLLMMGLLNNKGKGESVEEFSKTDSELENSLMYEIEYKLHSNLGEAIYNLIKGD